MSIIQCVWNDCVLNDDAAATAKTTFTPACKSCNSPTLAWTGITAVMAFSIFAQMNAFPWNQHKTSYTFKYHQIKSTASTTATGTGLWVSSWQHHSTLFDLFELCLTVWLSDCPCVGFPQLPKFFAYPWCGYFRHSVSNMLKSIETQVFGVKHRWTSSKEV